MAAEPPDPTPDERPDPDPAPAAKRSGGLTWEAENAKRVGVLSLIAAAATIIGSIVSNAAQAAVPNAEDRILTIVDTLRLAAEGRPIPGGRLAAIAEYLSDNPAPFVLGGVLIGLGVLLAFAPLAYIFRAARHRRPELPQIALIAAAIGAVGYGVGLVVTRTSYYLGAASFGDDGDRSNSAAAEALNNSGVAVGGLFAQIGQLALAVGFALVGLNAMRVGLLTRFLGVLGVIVGATLILPLDQLGLIRAAWLALAGILILGRWPGGRPRAWSTDEPVPWPTQQQLREERERMRRERAGEAGEDGERGPSGRRGSGGRGRGAQDGGEQRPPAARAPQPRRPEPDAKPHSSSQKRKRKRRS